MSRDTKMITYDRAVCYFEALYDLAATPGLAHEAAVFKASDVAMGALARMRARNMASMTFTNPVFTQLSNIMYDGLATDGDGTAFVKSIFAATKTEPPSVQLKCLDCRDLSRGIASATVSREDFIGMITRRLTWLSGLQPEQLRSTHLETMCARIRYAAERYLLGTHGRLVQAKHTPTAQVAPKPACKRPVFKFQRIPFEEGLELINKLRKPAAQQKILRVLASNFGDTKAMVRAMSHELGISDSHVEFVIAHSELLTADKQAYKATRNAAIEQELRRIKALRV